MDSAILKTKTMNSADGVCKTIPPADLELVEQIRVWSHGRLHAETVQSEYSPLHRWQPSSRTFCGDGHCNILLMDTLHDPKY